MNKAEYLELCLLLQRVIDRLEACLENDEEPDHDMLITEIADQLDEQRGKLVTMAEVRD